MGMFVSFDAFALVGIVFVAKVCEGSELSVSTWETFWDWVPAGWTFLLGSA